MWIKNDSRYISEVENNLSDTFLTRMDQLNEQVAKELDDQPQTRGKC